MTAHRDHQSLPFKSGWWAFGLPHYRPTGGTYALYPADSLPPISGSGGALNWLTPLEPALDLKMAKYRNPPAERGQVATIQAEAASLSLSLPPTFVHLMSSPELQDRIPSCTACYFRLSEHLIPLLGGAAGYVVRFLHDQQDVLAWYLYFTPTGELLVVASPLWLDEIAVEGPNSKPQDQWQAINTHAVVCAPSFDDFLYRWWLENTIWFKLNDGRTDTLTDEERHYLMHYEQKRL